MRPDTAAGTASAESPVAGRGDAAGTPWAADYLRARALEGRLYPDSLVAVLPDVPAAHPLSGEWRVRADSARRLTGYLRHSRRPLRVVEVGCGNGWLAKAIAGIAGSEVVGLDGSPVEIRQAIRVFAGAPNLRFVLGDATLANTPIDSPNVIVLASAVQYVADLPALVRRLLGWLAPGGELHILDSPLYRPGDVAGARARSRLHYERLGVPDMAGHYFHHAWSELEPFRYEVLYRPDGLRPRLERRLLGLPRAPFPWLRIRAPRAA